MSTASIAAPQVVEETGIRRNLLEDLALKILYLTGELTIRELAEQMHLGLGIAEELFQRLRKDQVCEVKGMVGGVYRIAITSQGKARALELLAQSQYAGPVPVSLTDYAARIHSQSVRATSVSPDQVQRGFRHLVLTEQTLTQLGTAVVSGTSTFLYGPPGTGKTAIAEALPSLYEDSVWIPHAVEIDGQIITVYDSAVHQRAADVVPEESDPRWVLCRRPRVIAGGELTIEMLDLQFNPISKFYSAPAQMKANNGVLIIDDFGRQRIRPEELLNRWIVPLDRKIDFLSLMGGKKFEVPFDLFVVFATNLDPATLADDAFLRRIANKIRVDFVTPEQFHEVFRGVCPRFGLQYDAAVVDDLISALESQWEEPLRPCYPRDIVQQICWAARYEGRPPKLDRPATEQACRNYFLPG